MSSDRRQSEDVQPDPKATNPQRLVLVPLMRRVENTAWKLILRCLAAENRSSLCLPIPIERWVEGPLGVRLEIADLRHLETGAGEVLGATLMAEKSIRISDRIADQENRFRFTVAHELGHLTLHDHLSGRFRDSSDGEFLSAKFEREADRFAAAFLIPENAFRQELVRFCGELGLAATELLASVSREEAPGTRMLIEQVLPRLSRRFGVAQTTALGRFRDLQIDGTRPMIPYRVISRLQISGASRRQPPR